MQFSLCSGDSRAQQFSPWQAYGDLPVENLFLQRFSKFSPPTRIHTQSSLLCSHLSRCLPVSCSNFFVSLIFCPFLWARVGKVGSSSSLKPRDFLEKVLRKVFANFFLFLPTQRNQKSFETCARKFLSKANSVNHRAKLAHLFFGLALRVFAIFFRFLCRLFVEHFFFFSPWFP